MSRAPGISGIIDIRSAAILQEHVLTTNPCAPVALTSLKKQNHQANLEAIKKKKIFDTARSWVTLGSAMFIIATVMGIFQATYLLVPIIQRRYDIGIVLVVTIYLLAYMLIIKISTLACICIKFIGHRLTVTFGMILFFFGLILDVFTDDEPEITWYISLIVMAIGASFATTAAMSIISDLFRIQLAAALALVSLATPFGILIFYLVTDFLVTHISYRWTRLVLATVVLVVTVLAQSFNKARKCAPEVLHPFDSDWQSKEKRIRDCVKNGVVTETLTRESASCDDLEEPNSCLCVCVCDISLWSDWSFLVWALVSMVAVIPYLIPYFFLIAYAFETGAETSIAFICWMCVASILMRIMLMMGDDFTFLTNRITFQVGLVVVGVLYIGLLWTETYGWILVWGIAMGAMEGLISVVIPRITLVTIPKKWIISSWSCILWFHALGIAIGPLIVVCIWWWTRGYTEAFITIAIIQFIGAIFATLLPNEESELFDANATTGAPATTVTTVTTVKEVRGAGNSVAYSSRFANSLRYTKINYQPSYGYDSKLGKTKQQTTEDKNYKCGCPICKKYGCIPGCTPCTPGGLAGQNDANFTGDPPAGMGNNQANNSQQNANPSNCPSVVQANNSQQNANPSNCPSVKASGNVASSEKSKPAVRIKSENDDPCS